MKSCCLTPTCCSQQRTDDSSPKRTSATQPTDIPMTPDHARSMETTTPVTSVAPPPAGHVCRTPCATCARRRPAPCANKSLDCSDSSLDIDLDDPHLVQALEDCVQRGGGGGEVGGLQRDINDVNIDNQETAANSTAERFKNVDFIGMFFKNNNQAREDVLRPNDTIAFDARYPNARNIVFPDLLPNASGRYFVRLPQPFIPPSRIIQANADSDELRRSVISDHSSSSPSCYQTGTNNSVPGVPANSPNDTSTSNSRFRLKVKHLQSFRRRPSLLRRQSSARKYVAKAVRHRRKLSKRSIARQQCCMQRTGPAGFDFRPPCQGQEGLPVQRIVCCGQRRVVGCGAGLTPLDRQRLRTACGRDQIPTMYCRIPAIAEAPGVPEPRNNVRRGIRIITRSPLKEGRKVPSAASENNTNTSKETKESESDVNSRASMIPMTWCPPQETVDISTCKVSEWLGSLAPEDMRFTSYEWDDEETRASMAVEVKRPRNFNRKPAHYVDPVRPLVSVTVNQFLYPMPPRRRAIMVASKRPEDRFPMSGCKRSLLERQHRCDVVKKFKRPRHEDSESSKSCSGNDDDQSSCGSRCGQQFGGYGERAIVEFPKHEGQKSRLANELDTSGSKLSLTLSESETSEEGFRMDAPPPSENSQIVSNQRDNVSRNLNPLPRFDCLREPISAMSDLNEQRQKYSSLERKARAPYRVGPSTVGLQSGLQRGSAVNRHLPNSTGVSFHQHQQITQLNSNTVCSFQQQQVTQKVWNTPWNTPATGYMSTPNTIYRPQHATLLADRRKQMVIRKLKAMNERLEQQTKQSDPLETLAIL